MHRSRPRRRSWVQCARSPTSSLRPLRTSPDGSSPRPPHRRCDGGRWHDDCGAVGATRHTRHARDLTPRPRRARPLFAWAVVSQGADLTIAPRPSARHRSSISAGPLHDSSATPRPAGPARGQRRRSILGARSQDHPLTPTTAQAGLRPRYRFVRPLRVFTAAANDPMCFEDSHAPSDVPIVPERHASLRSTHSYPETATILVPGGIWWPSEASA